MATKDLGVEWLQLLVQMNEWSKIIGYHSYLTIHLKII